jgi:hypothetical protein
MKTAAEINLKTLLRKFKCAQNNYDDILGLAHEFDSELRCVWQKALIMAGHDLSPDEPEISSDEENTESGVNIDYDDADETTSNASKEAKLLYRKISLLTHPDKLLFDDLSEEGAKEKTSLFIRAREAYSNDDTDELIKIALTLDIDMTTLGYDIVKITQRVEDLANKAAAKEKNLRGSLAWAWGVTNDDDKRVSIIHTLLRQNGLDIDIDFIKKAVNDYDYDK